MNAHKTGRLNPDNIASAKNGRKPTSQSGCVGRYILFPMRWSFSLTTTNFRAPEKARVPRIGHEPPGICRSYPMPRHRSVARPDLRSGRRNLYLGTERHDFDDTGGYLAAATIPPR